MNEEQIQILKALTALQKKVDTLTHRGMGRVFTFSIVVGTKACDAHCPFCVSRMTGFAEIPPCRTFNRQRFDKAARLAQLRHATTVLLTGKGEPTLYPEEITRYLRELQRFNFPIVELQTNALQIAALAGGKYQFKKCSLKERHLLEWKELGLNTIAISLVDVDDGEHSNNSRIYNNGEGYSDLATTIRYLDSLGFSIRLCIMMQKGMVGSPKAVQRVVDSARAFDIPIQLTLRPIRYPANNDHSAEADYCKKYGLDQEQIGAINEWAQKHGTHILTIGHGAHAIFVFDVDGQNVAVGDCLTVDAATDDIRTLIYYGDGRITYDWAYKGAIIM